MTETQTDTAPPGPVPAATSWFERWTKKGTAILTSLAALVGAVYGVGSAIGKFGENTFFQRLWGSSPASTATAAGAAPARAVPADCPAWQQSVASTFDREYQRHEGNGYTVALKQRFTDIKQASDAGAALSDEVWGRPQFPVAVEQRSGRYVVGIGFNLTREKASDLSAKMQGCYGQSVELFDPSVALTSPRKVVS